jgi:uncharacterized protein GlcG (DUF336 family)
MATKAPQSAPAEAQSAPADPAGVRFVSRHGNLIVYHKDHKIAVFEGGVFVTDDAKIIGALRAHELAEEVT